MVIKALITQSPEPKSMSKKVKPLAEALRNYERIIHQSESVQWKLDELLPPDTVLDLSLIHI